MNPRTGVTGHGARGPRVGLLGGSFNPAHLGHRHISLLALKRLHLDQIWWLVSPQNPLKPVAGMAPYADRLASARKIAGDRRIHISEAEADLGTRYTVDTLRGLRQRHPHNRFVWIMGADNLIQITKWHQWIEIFETVPVAVFDRPTYSFQALASTAAKRYARCRLKEHEGGTLADRAPPAWIFLWGSNDPTSATALRATSGA
ncbi:MAG: nicotinic acid mononucleotide adenylyltransferase [Alphaproteobacteria bacterium]|nr:nicotinic acid mononucleotide adenylyltransferase [Alphaproteobacteria bacterium]